MPISENTEQGAKRKAIRLPADVDLRDYFAGAALSALPPGYYENLSYAARYAYEMADAMIAERDQP